MAPKSDDEQPAKGKADEKLPRDKEVLRLIEEYAKDLRKLLEKLRMRLH